MRADNEKIPGDPGVSGQIRKTTDRQHTVAPRGPLSKTMVPSIDHPESKYVGDVKQLKRQHIHVSEIVHIGKEANNSEDEPLETEKVQVFRNKEKERWMIVGMRQGDAERKGIDRKTRWRMKKKFYV